MPLFSTLYVAIKLIEGNEYCAKLFPFGISWQSIGRDGRAFIQTNRWVTKILCRV